MISPDRIHTKVVRDEIPGGRSRLSIVVFIDGIECGRVPFLSNTKEVVDEFIAGKTLGEIARENVKPPVSLADVLYTYGAAQSLSIARRLIAQGRVLVAGEKVEDPTAPAPKDNTPIRVGPRVIFFRRRAA